MDMTTRSNLRELNDHHDHSDLPSASSDRSRQAAPARPVAATIGSGWYHDAAIERARHDAVEARCNPYR